MDRPDGRKHVDVFDRDAADHGGYLYTTGASLSSRLATDRSTEMILATNAFVARRVVDIGCGDGFYTVRYWDQAHPRRMVGADAAIEALLAARRRLGHRSVELVAADAHVLPYRANSFDVALVQSILHHDDRPREMIQEAFRLAPLVVIHEPNGNNLGLKVLEKTLAYHREHGEKSYSTRTMQRWVREAGGEIRSVAFAGFVPMFCPDWVARGMKLLEPLVERTPVVNTFACAVYVVVATRRAS